MTDQPKPCEMPDWIYTLFDSPHTGTFCDVNDGGVKYTRADRTPSPSDSLAQPSLLKNVPTRSSTTAAELSPSEEQRKALEWLNRLETYDDSAPFEFKIYAPTIRAALGEKK